MLELGILLFVLPLPSASLSSHHLARTPSSITPTPQSLHLCVSSMPPQNCITNYFLEYHSRLPGAKHNDANPRPYSPPGSMPCQHGTCMSACPWAVRASSGLLSSPSKLPSLFSSPLAIHHTPKWRRLPQLRVSQKSCSVYARLWFPCLVKRMLPLCSLLTPPWSTMAG